ncbi:hypothetical protein CTI14_59770, partial [Methylobacterium radiotolerans]
MGGRMVSEPLTRLAFAMFVIFSVPVGLHHQYADPNINNTWKTIHMFLTFLVAVPSLLTAFSVRLPAPPDGRPHGQRTPHPPRLRHVRHLQRARRP